MQLATDAAATCTDGIWPNEICFDFSNLNFIRPTGMAFLCNMVDWLASLECKVFFQGHTALTAPLRYLDDSQFFNMKLGANIRINARCRSTTFQLQQVRHSDSSASLALKFLPWLADRLDATPQAVSLQDIKTCSMELFNNIRDHTQFDIGCICAQHYPRDNQVEIAIADFGLGIPNSVRKIRPEMTEDASAITEAFVLGFTTKGHPNNMGAGLPFLRDNCVGVHGSTVTVYSGYSILTHYRQNGVIQSTPQKSENFCPGTVISIILNKGSLDLSEAGLSDLDW